MKVAIETYVAQASSKELMQALQDVGIDAFVARGGYGHRTHTFNYGCSGFDAWDWPKVGVNQPKAVMKCVDKVLTFKALIKAGVPTIPFVTNRRKIPKRWEHVVVRQSRTGRKAEGYAVVPNDGNVPDGELFTEYFHHKYEYRIVVFNGEVVGRYYKKLVGKYHEFMVQRARGFEAIDNAAIRASKALGIDYVGFDVVANTKQDFRFLEANSAPMLMPEAKKAIIDFYLRTQTSKSNC